MGMSTQKPDYITIGFEQIDRDLRFLVGAFADVLRDLGHGELAAHLPWISDGKGTPAGEPPQRLGLAYSVAFQLLNMVEENAAATVRELREEHEGVAAEKGLWGSHLAALKAAGTSEDDIVAQMRQVRVEPVLTAHPTEAKRLTVLDHHRMLFALLQQGGTGSRTPGGVRRRAAEVKAALERLWRTGEILLEKPTLADERRNVLHYLRDVFPAVLPVLDERLRLAWSEAGFNPARLAAPDALPRIGFGTWVGGDRDGHPGVTAEVTRESLERLRANALLVHHRNLTALAEKLTLTTWMQPPPVALRTAIGRMADALGNDAARILASHGEEPWRQFVELMLARLPLAVIPGQLAELREGDGLYHDAAELAADLDVLHSLLVEAGAQRLADADVGPPRRALEVFGFHLANLDIRQNSAFHAKALSQLMSAAGIDGSQWEEWSEAERLRFLERELQSPRPFLHPSASAGPEADAVVGCHRVLAAHIARFGADGVGALIVSMTRRLSDLLVVYVLAREAGLLRAFPEGIVCLLPVVPLFETADDLERGPEMLRQFLAQPVTRRSLEFQSKRDGTEIVQQVMVGYSDSNKDAGILASQWALHRAQAQLAAVGKDAGIGIRFFHGRGGTVSRGAGPTHRFLDALAHGSLQGDIRLTEQGETIAQKFANPATAAYNLELLLAGVTVKTGRHARERQSPRPLTPVVEKLAASSRAAYRGLLEAEGFLSFYRQATPIDALEHSRIGSRPSRRTGQPSLADLRAIPWVFSWNQSRFYVPGWFGAGSALASLTEEELTSLSAGLRSWPFLHYVFTNIESSIASSDRDLMCAYADMVEDTTVRERLLGHILREWDLTRAMLERLRGGPMADRRPRMWKTLHLRTEALRILHLQQIALLRKWRGLRASGDEKAADAMLPDLLLSINAIASGLRTTG